MRRHQVYPNLLRTIMSAQDQLHYANWERLVFLEEELFVAGAVEWEHLNPNKVQPRRKTRHNSRRLVVQAFLVAAAVGVGKGEVGRRTYRQATSLRRPLRDNQHQIRAVREAVV
jgi:hypothetical protein